MNEMIKEFNNGDFVRLKIYAISNKVNRNNSEIMLESFDSGIATIKNKPILAYYNPIIGDAEEHNSRMGIDTYGNTYYDYQYDKSNIKPLPCLGFDLWPQRPESCFLFRTHT